MTIARITSEFKELGRRVECPICQHAGRCKARADGAVLCFRERAEHVNDYIRVKANETCAVFLPTGVHFEQQATQRNGHTRRIGTMTRRTTSDAKHVEGEQTGPVDLDSLWRQHRASTSLDPVTILANALGVSREGLWAAGYARGPGVDWFAEKDASGKVIGIVTRYENGEKIIGKGHRRGLYIPTDFDRTAEVIVIPEGASDVAALHTMGVQSIGRPNDKGGVEFLTELLRGVAGEILLPIENDRKSDGKWPGRDGALSVAKRLANALNRTIGVIHLPADIKDPRALLVKMKDPAKAREVLLACERTVVEPEAAVEVDQADPDSHKAQRLRTRRAADVTPEHVQWLWPQRFPLGKVSLLAGDPGVGKSFVTLDLAARVSCGRAWPDARDVPQQAGEILILNAEDGASDTIVPRLISADADLRRIHLVDGVADQHDAEPRLVSLERDVTLLGGMLEENPSTRLVVVDPISAFFGSDRDSHRDTEVRAVLAPLAKLAEVHGVAVLLVAHLSKTSKATSPAAIHRVLGSMGFVGLARSVWAVTRDPREDADADSRLLVRVKGNIGRDPGGLAFQISDGHDGPSVRWFDGVVDLSADDAMAPKANDGEGRRGNERRDATEWLTRRLAAGPVARKTVVAEAESAGFSPRTIDRAAADLKLRTVRREWILPATLLESVT